MLKLGEPGLHLRLCLQLVMSVVAIREKRRHDIFTLHNILVRSIERGESGAGATLTGDVGFPVTHQALGLYYLRP